MTFIPNKYTRTYFRIVTKAREERRVKFRRNHPSYVYYELHHVIPLCMGGADDDSNLVHLTAREHFIAHMLLVRMTEGPVKYKLFCAVRRMKRQALLFSSHSYERAVNLKRAVPIPKDIIVKIIDATKRGMDKPSVKSVMAEKKAKPFAFIDSDGIVHQGVNLFAWCKVHGHNQGAMNRVRKGLKQSYKGLRLHVKPGFPQSG